MTSKATNAYISAMKAMGDPMHAIGCQCDACVKFVASLNNQPIQSRWNWNDSDEHKIASVCFVIAIALVILVALY
jgi:hypothetical protein